MKKVRDFLKRNSGKMLMLVASFIVFVAQTSTTTCLYLWHYEPVMPNCLRED